MRPCIEAPTIDPDPALDFRESTGRLSSEELDVEILNTLLFTDDSDLPGPTSRAFVTQLRLISSFAEMTPYTIIRSLINVGFSRVMMIRQVTAGAVRFVKLEKLIQQHTEKKFQYLKILQLEGHNLLTPQSVPHLFRAAVVQKKMRGNIQGLQNHTRTQCRGLRTRDRRGAARTAVQEDKAGTT